MRDSFSNLAEWNWEVFLSLIALAFSIYVFLTQRWANREARLEVRYEEARHPKKWSNSIAQAEDEYRMVLVNHGPHDAKDVNLTVYRIDGVETRGMRRRMIPSDIEDVGDLPEALPVPVLHPGQTYHLPFTTAIGNRPWSAKVSWKDGRFKRQTRHVWLSTIRL